MQHIHWYIIYLIVVFIPQKLSKLKYDFVGNPTQHRWLLSRQSRSQLMKSTLFALLILMYSTDGLGDYEPNVNVYTMFSWMFVMPDELLPLFDAITGIVRSGENHVQYFRITVTVNFKFKQFSWIQKIHSYIYNKSLRDLEITLFYCLINLASVSRISSYFVRLEALRKPYLDLRKYRSNARIFGVFSG